MATNEIDIKDEDLKEDDFTPEELDAEDVDWKAKAQELKGIAKRRATQLRKAKEALANPPKPELPVKKDNSKSDDKLLERLESLELSSSSINEADEVELAKNNWSKYKDSGGTKEFGEFLLGDGVLLNFKKNYNTQT